jgi:hypothetical protein
MGDDLTRWDLEPWQVEGFMVIDATESPDGKWVKYDEAATLITSLREALEEATKLNNKYAWERDKAREERDQAERKAEAFWRPQVERLEVALNPSRKETI